MITVSTYFKLIFEIKTTTASTSTHFELIFEIKLITVRTYFKLISEIISFIEPNEITSHWLTIFLNVSHYFLSLIL